jgi:hypothetical protein
VLPILILIRSGRNPAIPTRLASQFTFENVGSRAGKPSPKTPPQGTAQESRYFAGLHLSLALCLGDPCRRIDELQARRVPHSRPCSLAGPAPCYLR